MSKQTETSIVYTTSHLALVPLSAIPAYSVSKAALNAFILCLRDQLRESPVEIIELLPPVVQTELHDYIDKGSGRQMGMPAGDFANEAYEGLASGNDQIIIGGLGLPGHPNKVDALYKEVIAKRRTAFEGLANTMRGNA